eukprot:1148563-Pelagomonas_calceolata.AAC.3
MHHCNTYHFKTSSYYSQQCRVPQTQAEQSASHLGLDLIIQGDVSHLLAGVEQAVLGRLAEDVLGSAHQHSGIQGGHAPACQHGASGLREHEQAEENQTGDKQQGGSDESSCTPAKLAEDDAGQKHHGEGHCTSGCAEVTHEAGVVVGVGELGLDLRLPGHLHQVDGNTVGHHLRANEGRAGALE